MSTRLAWWLSPPLLLTAVLLAGQVFSASARAQATETAAKQAAQQHAQAQRDAAAAVAAESAKVRFTLEVRGLGITVDRFRQSAVWQRIDRVNDAYQSIISQNPRDYEWGSSTRYRYFGVREGNAFKAALGNWVERWPIPVLAAGPSSRFSPALHITSGRQSGGMGIHLFTVLGTHPGEGADALVKQVFDFFDHHPELPAVVLYGFDNARLRGETEGIDNGYFVPRFPDSIVALLVTRSDRIDRDIRPYAMDVPYDINLEDTRYDVIKLWNDYWDADTEYLNTPNNHEIMPVAFWNERVPALLSKVDPNGSQGKLLAFWDRGKKGFKPNAWVPVRWTKWQLEEYDDAPLYGYLHRPVEVPLSTQKGPKHASANAAAMATGWQQALATLPEGEAAQRIFFDTGNDALRLIPLARAMAEAGTPHPLSIDDPAASYDIGRRIGNTGVSSPFVQLALALMRSYEKGGASATVNLRQPERASIIMVSPPEPNRKAKNHGAANPFDTPDQPGL